MAAEVLLMKIKEHYRTLFRAPVAELVDAADSKSVVRMDVGVRVSLGAPRFFDGILRSIGCVITELY